MQKRTAQTMEKLQSQRKQTNSRELIFQVEARSLESLEGEEKERMIVEGYAVRFN